MVSKSIGIVVRIIMAIVFVGCLVCSFILWRGNEPMLGGLVLFIGLGVFFGGGIVLWILQKIHKRGVYTYDAWKEQGAKAEEVEEAEKSELERQILGKNKNKDKE